VFRAKEPTCYAGHCSSCIVGLIAGGLGLWRLEGTAMWIAELLAVVFVILFLVSLVSGRRRGA
jgi:uncharacterized membrane protein YtjA (UPF0391 family)